MAQFYVEKKENESGEHLVHASTCECLPAEETMHYMGAYAQPPVWEAFLRYRKVAKCPNCLPA